MIEWVVIAAFCVGTWWIGAWAARRVETPLDYMVAGRKLGLGMVFPTLLATWFGAGTLLVAADEVAESGLSAAALDPIGAGLCLWLAGAWLARPLWRMQLATLPDFYLRVFGRRAEVVAAWLMVPGYLGWIAAQFAALAAVLEQVAGVPWSVGLPLVAAFGIVYTALGGMWSVAVTDAAQIAVAAAGLMLVAAVVFAGLGDGDPWLGVARTWAATDAEARRWIPDDRGPWIAALLAGSLGNLPGQDLCQRLFAARSEGVAVAACALAGAAYFTLGAVPLALALAARWTLEPATIERGAVLITLVQELGGRPLALAFAVVVAATVLSTIDSAILAPSTVLTRNVAARWIPETLAGHRVMVVVIGALSTALAAIGEDAYALLELSYEVGLVSLLVPLLFGVWWPRSEAACLAAMAMGTASWLLHVAAGVDGLLGSPIPMGVGSAAIAAATYGVIGSVTTRQAPGGRSPSVTAPN